MHISCAGNQNELTSHRLSDSSQESQSQAYSHLSSISSQPSSVELRRLASFMETATHDDEEPEQRNQLEADVSADGISLPSSGSSFVLADIPKTADEKDDGSEASKSLKAESELIDQWAAPFDSSLPADRYCKKF